MIWLDKLVITLCSIIIISTIVIIKLDGNSIVIYSLLEVFVLESLVSKLFILVGLLSGYFILFLKFLLEIRVL